jgi:hypothetical protein
MYNLAEVRKKCDVVESLRQVHSVRFMDFGWREKIKMVVKTLAFLNSNGSSTTYFHFLSKHVADIKLHVCVIQKAQDLSNLLNCQNNKLP